MNEKKNAYSLAKYSFNETNPFLNEAIEKIQSNIVKKYKNATNTGEKAILKAVDDNGELIGHTSFIRQVEVDEERFTKIYLREFSAFFDLKPQAIKVFGYIMTKLIPKQDMFFFLLHECLTYTGYKSKNSIWIGLGALVENKIIARGPADTVYFINPMVAFNGDRVTFARTYVKKKAKDLDPNQTNLLSEFKGGDFEE